MVSEIRGQRQAVNDDVITVDVRRTYPQKTELNLQDFMDVEYVALETNDDFVNQGFVQSIGSEFIIVRNRINDGDIFVYSRSGKALRKINRKGHGSEEYTNIYSITLDEDNEELFVNDIFARKICVYDLFGKFKRYIKHKDGTMYTDIFNYDCDNLICYDSNIKDVPFVIISKQDGVTVKEIKIPFKEKKFLRQTRSDEGTTYSTSPGPYRRIIPFKGNWLLSELSSDTVFSLLPDFSLQPFLVRTPTIQTMDPGVFLVLRFISDRYIFMETIRNEYNWATNRGFPRDFLMYDRQVKSLLGYTIYNGDYSIQKELYMNSLTPVNHEIESWRPIEPFDLIESLKKGELKDGKLKEIAKTLDEEDNPVIMLIKHKK